MYLHYALVLLCAHLMTPAEGEGKETTAIMDIHGNIASMEDIGNGRLDAFVLPPIDANAVGYTLTFNLVSFPLQVGIEEGVNFTTLANVEMSNYMSLSIDIQYPLQVPVLTLIPGPGKDPHRCVGKNRIDINNQLISVQLIYAHSTRLLSILLYHGQLLSKKCSYRTDASVDFSLTNANNKLYLSRLQDTSRVGFISALEFYPRVLPFLEINYALQDPFLLNERYEGRTVKYYRDIIRSNEDIILSSNYSLFGNIGRNKARFRIRRSVRQGGLVDWEEDQVPIDYVEVPTINSQCGCFLTPSTAYFGYQSFGASTDNSEVAENYAPMNGIDFSKSVAILVTPYWYLEGHPTTEPEIFRPSMLETIKNGSPIVDFGRLDDSSRVLHFMESLCAISRNIDHIVESSSNNSRNNIDNIVVDVVLLLAAIDASLLTTKRASADSILDDFRYTNPHLNIIIAEISNDCHELSSADCIYAIISEEEVLINLKKPEPRHVIRTINRVASGQLNMSRGFRSENPAFFALLSTNVLPVYSEELHGDNWLYNSYEALTQSSGDDVLTRAVVGSKILSVDDGRVLNYGYELVPHAYVGGQDTLLVPRERYRGYWANDPRTQLRGLSSLKYDELSEILRQQPVAVSISMVMLSSSHFIRHGGLNTSIEWPAISFIDYCLRVSFKSYRSSRGYLQDIINPGVIDMVRSRKNDMAVSIDASRLVDCFGLSVLPVVGEEIAEIVSNYDLYNLDRLVENEAVAMRSLTEAHLTTYQIYSRLKQQLEYYLSHMNDMDLIGYTKTPPLNPIMDVVDINEKDISDEARLVWTIHCGGSQGFEAATILQSLDQLMTVRTIVRGYRHCEHSDTLSDMPMYFQDIFDANAYRSHIKPYEAGLSVDRSALDEESGEISLYARDYREIGRWIPDDASYVIGRYMYEADRIPKPWAYHCNLLDEIWVPSLWQKNAFIASGVSPHKIQVMHETVDSNLFSPTSVKALRLPGSVLDGFERNDPNRPFAFCSVFKMEDRKGWKELVRSYLTEFMFDSKGANVVLVLRTYRHSQAFISEEDFSKKYIMGNISQWVDLALGGLLRRLPSISLPPIEVVSEHLSSKELAMFYKACDAFVLPTHGEGWGLPTHEAMAMGLPVITTNWGGSTEFTTPIRPSELPVALLINTVGLVKTTGDNWLDGQWADIDEADLRNNLRELSSDRAFARDIGLRGRVHVLRHFNQQQVAFEYARRIKEIDNIVRQKRLSVRSDTVVDASLLRFLDEAAEPPMAVASDANTWSLSELPRGSLVAAITGSDYAMTERYQTCRLLGPRNHRKRFRRLFNKTFIRCDMAIMTTWEPRHCGIATYSSELRKALLTKCPADARIDVIAARWRDQPNHEFNSSVVKGTVRDLEFHDIIRVAKLINSRGYHTVLIQFEFGMLYGEALVCALRALHAPVLLITQHTITRVMLEYQHSLARELHFLADRSIVMTETMRRTMNAFHGISPNRVVVIPHGIPEYTKSVSNDYGGQTHYLRAMYPNSTIVMSNGLIHPYKGIEFVIWAIAGILRRHPKTVYLIYGIPHPNGGNHTRDYYAMLLNESAKIQPSGHIIFNNTYLNTDELMYVLTACDIYVNAYTERQQAVSGTLSMALGTGSVAVSTPYPHALELLRDGVGIFVPFENSNAIAKAVVELLDNPAKMKSMKEKAAKVAKNMSWGKVAESYLDIIDRVSLEQSV